jgi:class 3 adenylate cyclase
VRSASAIVKHVLRGDRTASLALLGAGLFVGTTGRTDPSAFATASYLAAAYLAWQHASRRSSSMSSGAGEPKHHSWNPRSDGRISPTTARHLETNVANEQFRSDQTYENVFLIFLDAAGHSSIVANNARDHASRAFDLLHGRVVSRLRAIAEDRRCARAQLWRWAGDGGFLAVHDDEESVARDVALEFVRGVLQLDVRHLREEFREIGISGELHMRVAVHRGTIRYRGVGLEGSIYSPDINFAAHLEKVAPPDTVLVSEDVYRVAGRYADMFELAGWYENRPVYLFAGSGRPGDAARAWLTTRGFAGGAPVLGYAERPSQIEKARMLKAATTEFIDLGSALRTASRYLVTTERPAVFRDAAIDFLRRGGRYRCVLMDPDAEATRVLSAQRGEDFAAKIRQSLADFKRFKDRAGNDAERLEVYQTTGCPAMGCLAIDLDEPHALILTSPYLAAPGIGAVPAELSELPHYLVGRSAGRLFTNLRELLLTFVDLDAKRVL